ncbi:response regulator transcription factor [Maricaulis maris]|nr:response regulator transcription factor [Maricaulis maris]
MTPAQSPSDKAPAMQGRTVLSETGITALILDDHQIVIDGMARLLRDQGLVDHVLSRSSLAGLADDQAFDALSFAIIDVGLAGESGLDAVATLRSATPSLPCILMTGSPLDADERQRLQDHTGHFYHKQDPVEQLISVVRDVLDANPTAGTATGPESPDIDPDLTPPGLGRIGQLTRRERDVLRQIGRGAGLTEIAARLGIARATVRKHRENIMDKLAVRSSARLVRIALQIGLS